MWGKTSIFIEKFSLFWDRGIHTSIHPHWLFKYGIIFEWSKIWNVMIHPNDQIFQNENDRHNIDIYRGLIEIFSLFWDQRGEALVIVPLNVYRIWIFKCGFLGSIMKSINDLWMEYCDNLSEWSTMVVGVFKYFETLEFTSFNLDSISKQWEIKNKAEAVPSRWYERLDYSIIVIHWIICLTALCTQLSACLPSRHMIVLLMSISLYNSLKQLKIPPFGKGGPDIG